MKKYRQSSVNLLACLTVLCILMIIVGILLILFAPSLFNHILFFIVTGVQFGIILITVLIPTMRNYLLLDDEKIVFPITRTPKVNFKRNEIAFKNIKNIQTIFYKGNGIFTKDTTFYCFTLNDGTVFEETFYSYGKNSEKEIVSHLKEHIRFI